MQDAYQKRGVSADKSEVKEAIKKQDQGLFPGAFAKIEKDVAGSSEHCFLLHADGAGTKSIVAYLRYLETKDPQVFSSIAHDSFVMNSDDLLAVGCLGPFYLSNTIGRNAQRVPGEVLNALIEGYAEVGRMLEKYGIEVIPTGGETADVGDLVQTVICDSTLAVRMLREEVIDASRIAPDQCIVGLSSFGQTTYETSQNSGIASNGLTAARHLLLSKHYREAYPESYASSLDHNLAYVGRYLLQDKLSGSDLSVGEALQAPTRTYLPVFKDFLPVWRNEIFGLIHNTGGALTKSLNFGERGTRFVKDNLFSRPAIFEAIAATGELLEKDMYRVFNLGQLMEVYCTEKCAHALIQHAATFNLEARIIGYTERAKDPDEKELYLKDRGNEYIY